MKFIKSFSLFESTPEMSADLGVFLKDSGVSPDFVPHEDFYKYKWLLPKGKKSKWYYAKESNGFYQLPSSDRFLESLDEELKESVSALHEKGIATTPSCSGHFYDENYYSGVYQDLIRECQEIRDSGLELIDPESDESIIVRDPKYMIPWNEKTFIERGLGHGHIGTIGVYDPSGKIINAVRENKTNCSQILEEGNLMLFITNPQSESELTEAWQKFTEAVVGCKV